MAAAALPHWLLPLENYNETLVDIIGEGFLRCGLRCCTSQQQLDRLRMLLHERLRAVPENGLHKRYAYLENAGTQVSRRGKTPCLRASHG